MTLGITIPLGMSLPEHATVLPRLAESGYDEFWSSETAGFDAFTPLVHAAAVLPGARFGTAIAGVFQRGPALLAMSAAGLAEAAPGRFTLGVGAASPAIVERWNGIPYRRPVRRVRESVEFLRAALAGEKLPNGFRLERPPATPPPILVAALRPTMLRLAGSLGDGAILNWLSADDVATVVPYVHEGGPGKRVAARVFLCPTDEPDAVRAAAKRLITGYLTVPGYADFQRFLGRSERLEPMWRAWQAGDRRAAVQAVEDALVDELFVIGTPAECAAHVRRYVHNGVHVPVLAFVPLDPSRDTVTDAIAVAEHYQR
ncbi:LLM class F420-dependent oxidoreductase [Rugosimonospora africana]|uniref:LLM class F420-dependent oxidoreductase n=1 Tax=Rugosimonospora africana TaxID=556532 RepID=A0A8J3QU06_9ACTN|nr:LLM class F420-dependent oxidoreductase [Rugosimonospora africana]GIH16456.1 LLM class F420-dependent oxidoreductase [Rugosimonospora africana]